jgi:hypothetical protein
MQIVFRSSHLLMTPCLLLHCLRLSLLICKVHNMYEIMQSLTIAGVSLDREAGYDRHPTVLRGLDLEFIHYVLILLPFSSLTCVLNSTLSKAL